jgi:hypothetical protein
VPGKLKTRSSTVIGHARYEQLFLAMAEELKLPLQHIARQAELQQLQPDVPAGSGLQDIQASADMTLQLLDSYLLSLRLSLQPEGSLQLEPVSLSAVLHDTAAELRHIAANYGVTLNLHVEGRYEPVLAHRQALQAALVALGYAVIEALPASGVQHQHLQLATHRTRQGIVAGVYGELDGLTPHLYRRAQALQGRVRQPLVETMPGSGAGVFVADAILAAMASRLRVGRYMKLPGFAVTLPSSEQLQLV